MDPEYTNARREERSWTMQGVVIAISTGTPVSRQMVKWVRGLQLESFVSAEGTIQQACVPIKTCQVNDYEINLTKGYCEARGPEKLGLSLATANRDTSRIEEEDPVRRDCRAPTPTTRLFLPPA